MKLLSTLLVVMLSNAAAAAELQPVSMRAHSAGTFYIEGAIRGYGNLEFLVDTGSSFPVISADMLEVLQNNNAAEYVRELGGTMADGSRRVVPVYRLGEIRLGENCWLQDVEVAVFPAGSRPILGMSTLSRLAPFTFSANPPELGLSRCGARTVSAEAPAAGIAAGSP